MNRLMLFRFQALCRKTAKLLAMGECEGSRRRSFATHNNRYSDFSFWRRVSAESWPKRRRGPSTLRQ